MSEAFDPMLALELVDDVARQLLFGSAPRPYRCKVERQRFTLRAAHGDHDRFPAGTRCYISRARPDSFLVAEMDDGSVIELGPSWYVGGIESIEPFQTLTALFHASADLSPRSPPNRKAER